MSCSAYLWKYKVHRKCIYKCSYIRCQYSGIRNDPPLVLLVTYGMTSSNAYYYTKVMSELFLQTSTDGRVSFQSIGSMADFWVVSTNLACHGEPWNSAGLGYSVPSEVLSSDFSRHFAATSFCQLLAIATITFAFKILTDSKYSLSLRTVSRIMARLSFVCAQKRPFLSKTGRT